MGLTASSSSSSVCLVRKTIDQRNGVRQLHVHIPKPFGLKEIWMGSAAPEKSCHHPAFPSEACVFMLVSSKLFGRSSDLQATYLLQLPSPWLNQCLCRSVRSCLPLRGSSGSSPDSLLSLTFRSGTVK